MPTNVHPDFLEAEQRYLAAETKEQKIIALKKMISHAPGHKGAEHLRAQLKKRLARLKYVDEKETKRTKSSKTGIRKEDMQAVIIGMTRTGKSSLISLLTNAKPEIADYGFTTKFPIVGMMAFEGAGIQLIENPAIESEYYDKGLTHTADTLLIVANDFRQINEIEKSVGKTTNKKIIVFNDFNRSSEELRKIDAKLKSKKYNYVIVNLNSKNDNELNLLKEKLFQSFGKIRVYTKEPGKQKSSTRPIILSPDSNVKDVAEKILKGFSNKIKETRIWGPSSKYSGQVVGLQHKLKDLDVVEFKTK